MASPPIPPIMPPIIPPIAIPAGPAQEPTIAPSSTPSIENAQLLPHRQILLRPPYPLPPNHHSCR